MFIIIKLKYPIIKFIIRERAWKRVKRKGENGLINGIWAQPNGLNQQRADRGTATDEHS